MGCASGAICELSCLQAPFDRIGTSNQPHTDVIRLATYNVWFADQPPGRVRDRFDALLDLLLNRPVPLDIITLQEVNKAFWARLCMNIVARQDWAFTDVPMQHIRTGSFYSTAILVRRPFAEAVGGARARSVNLPSNFARCLTMMELGPEHRPWVSIKNGASLLHVNIQALKLT